MSVDVLAVAINSIQVSENNLINAHIRKDLLPISAAVSGLINHLNQTYNAKPVKGYGAFGQEKDRFELPMKKWQSGGSFSSFSEQLTNQLVSQLTQHNIIEGGYFMLCHYRYLATEFLLVTLLGTENHFSVSQNTNELSLNAADHLAIAKMQLAARIDLTELAVSPESNKYISYIRGRAGRKVADFFLDLLGCTEGVTPVQQSKAVLGAVEEFLNESDYDSSEKSEARKAVFSYCSDQSKQGLPVFLDEISSAVSMSDETSNDFTKFVTAKEIDIATEFPVDVKELKSLVKFTGSGGGINISFDQKHLGERVNYDMQSDTLTLKGIPPNLRDQLQRFLTGKSDFHK